MSSETLPYARRSLPVQRAGSLTGYKGCFYHVPQSVVIAKG